MKYMLIEVMEREISEPEYFDTHDAAHDEMCRRVAEVYDISPDEVKESYLEGEDLNENAVVLEDIAWAERYGKNFDWKIFAIERDTPAQVTAPPLFNMKTMRHMWLADVSETVCLGKNQKIGISVPLLHRTRLRN